MYLAVNTVPDLCVAASVPGSNVAELMEKRISAVKLVLRYVQGPTNHKLVVWTRKDIETTLFSDASWRFRIERKRNGQTGLVILYEEACIYVASIL